MQVLTEEQNLTDIANAIRYKKNAPDEKYSPGSMANAIMSIPTESGGGGGGGGGLIPIETRELALNFAPPPEGEIVDRLDWNAPSGYGYKNVFIKRPESLRQDTVKAGEVIFGVVGTYSGGGGDNDKPADPIDPKQYYKENRNPNYPYIPLPSEINEEKDVIYLLFDASGPYCCPSFYCTSHEDTINVIIKKFNNNILFSEEEDFVFSREPHYFQYSLESDSNYNSYNYIVFELRCKEFYIYYFNTSSKFDNVSLSYTDLLEVSGKCKNCSLSNSNNSSRTSVHKKIEYFSWNGGLGGLHSEYLFADSNLIAIPEFKTNEIGVSMKYMFNNCRSLIAIPKNFNVGGEADSLFYGCTSLKAIDTINFIRETSSTCMFQNCLQLEQVKTFINATYLTNGTSMFSGDLLLKKIPEGEYFSNSVNVTNRAMFYGCTSLSEIKNITFLCTDGTSMLVCPGVEKITNVKFPNITTAATLCSGNTKLKEVHNLELGKYFSENNESDSLTTVMSLFNGCTSLYIIDNLKISLNVTIYNRMFHSCSRLETVTFNTSTKNGTSFQYMFYNCVSLKNVFNLNTNNATNMTYIFSGCSSLKNVPNIKLKGNANYAFANCSSLENANFSQQAIPSSMSCLFQNCGCLRYINNLNTSNSTGFIQSFYQCTNLITIPELDLSNATSFKATFYYCTHLKNVTIKNFNGSIMVNPFNAAYVLTSLKILNFINTTIESEFFSSCYHITGTKNDTYNPSGLKDGYIYVPSDMVSTLKSTINWSTYATQIKSL